MFGCVLRGEYGSHRMGSAFLVLAFGISLTFTAQAQQTKGRALKPADLFRIRDVDSPRLSPDGKWVAYAVTTTSLEEKKSETRLWMIPSEGGEALPLTAEGYSASHPRWKPDGTMLAFLAAKKGVGDEKKDKSKSQVWTLNMRGGEAQQLTDIKQGVERFEWSPDGSRLVLSLRDPVEDRDQDGKADDENDQPEPFVIDRLQFKYDYEGYLTRRRTHLYVFDVANNSLRQITSGDYDDSEPVWSPDGKRIAFVSNRTEQPDANNNTDIWIVAADNTDQGQTLKRVTTNEGPDHSPVWSPDGKQIAHVSSVEPDIMWYATNDLAVTHLKDGSTDLLTSDVDRNVSSPRFTTGGRYIEFLLEDSAERQLARIHPNGSGFERLVKGDLSVYAYHQSSDRPTVLLVGKLNQPGEVYVRRDNQLKRLTHVNDIFLDSIRLADVENIHYKSRDGTEIEGFLYKPVGYEKGLKYPTILDIHGGPVAQYDFGFRFDPQLYAAHGYAVLQVNPRGSSGYGQDFSVAIWADWGNKDYDDVMAAVDYAIERGIADPERLGVGGWSYGGILTDHVITKTDRFEAAISGASEVLYVANYGHDHYQRQWETELGLPWIPENREKWERISPFNDVEKITTPTLVMGGTEDWNVPIQNSEQLYQALKRLGRTTRLVVYPGEHHGLREPAFQLDRLQRYLDWFDAFVKEKPKAEWIK